MKKKYGVRQQDMTDCGAACLSSVARYYGLNQPLARIRQYASTGKNGTNILGMIEAAERMGFTAKGVRAEPEALRQVCLPAIAHLVLDSKLAHYVVIYQVTKSHVIHMDPSDGRFYKEPLASFVKQWTGVLILLEPSGSFVGGDHSSPVVTRLLRYVRPHLKMLFQAFVGSVVTTILGLSTSIYIGKITDYVLVDGNRNLLNMMSLLMVAILLIQIFIGFVRDKVMLLTSQKIDAALILGYYQHILRLPQKFFDMMRVGEIISRLDDTTKIRSFISGTAMGILLNILTLTIALAVMVFFSWKLTLVIMATTPFFAVSYYFFNRLNKKYQRKTMERAADLQSQLVESLNNIGTVKRFGLEDFSNIKTESRYVRVLRNIYKAAVGGLYIGSGNTLVSSGVTIAVLWIGSLLVLDNEMTPGTLLMFYTLIGYVISPVVSLIGANSAIQDAMIAADRLFQIMDLEQEDASIDTEVPAGDIRFNHVSFHYGSRRNLFEDLTLEIPHGRFTAIVGASGSGKSTLAALLQRLYPIQGGQITIGGADLSLLSSRSLRAAISSVPQQVELFTGTLADNIAVGEFTPDLVRIGGIVSELGLDTFVRELPDGLNTQVGEHGFSLSGGERQRVAVARSLYRSPKVLILDEATSSLDSLSERYVLDTVRRQVSQGITVIVIAHRLSTIQEADKIIVLDQGKVVEEGRHEDLLEVAGKYRQLWDEQHHGYV